VVGDRGDKQQPPPADRDCLGLGVALIYGDARLSIAAGVGDLDAEALGGRSVSECQAEVAAGYAAVEDGVRSELGYDQLGTLREVRQCAPGPQLGHGEEPGEAGAARPGRQQLRERPYWLGQLGGLVHGASVVGADRRGRG
jgi:hypothetical protein